MRKVKLQMQLTVDGFVAGPNNEMDWMTMADDEEIQKYVNDLTDSCDCMLMGKNLATGFVPYWESVMADPNNPQYAFGKKMCDMPKVVFSKTLQKSEWKNATLANGDAAAVINKLKAQPGKDIIVYGGVTFVSDLVKDNLIDEYHLSINPVLIGEGKTIFKTIAQRMNLKLVKATPFSCGKVVLCYQPVRK